jgi:Kef-type K+ transport system membrane component KefB
LGITVVGLFHLIPQVQAPMMVSLALCTTGLGVLVPVFRACRQLETTFGRLFMAAGTLDEIGPIVAMSLLLSQRYSSWQEIGLLLAFLAIVGTTFAVGMGARPPKLLALLGRLMHSSTQLPVRLSLLILAAFIVVAMKFGFEAIFGAFAAGMILGQATRGEDSKPFREKNEAVCFGWFFPFFFVGTGVKFDITALGQDLTTMLLVPAFTVLFLVIRGAPVFLYRDAIAKAERLPFALASAVPSLSIIVVITEIGTQTKSMNPDIAAALISAALLAVLLFPNVCFRPQRGGAPGVWPKRQRILSITSFRACRCGNGYSPGPNGRATSFSVGGEVNGRCTSVSRRSLPKVRGIALA